MCDGLGIKLKEFLTTGKIDGKEIKVDESGNVTLGNGDAESNNANTAQQVVNNTLNAVQSQQQNLQQPTVEPNVVMQPQQPVVEPNVVAQPTVESQQPVQNINTNPMDLFSTLPNQPDINNFMSGN